MSKIAPLQAVIYNQDKVNNLSSVVCPPYDVISPAEQQKLYDKNPFNFIHIILSRGDNEKDKYEVASQYLEGWLKEKILIKDNSPAIYFYSQQYNVKGENKARYGFMCLLRLPEDRSAVFAHEHTRAAPKEDRLRLFRAVGANLSPIFVVFADKKRIIQRLSDDCLGKKPFLEATDESKTVHKVWRIDSPHMLADIQKKMDSENLFIADGHHRYEVSCIYRDEMKEKTGIADPDAPFNFTLAYFTNMDQRGLTIFAIHRLVKLARQIDMAGLRKELLKYFDIEEIKEKNRFFFLLEKAGGREHVFGMYKDNHFYLLRLKNVKILDNFSQDKSKAYRSLDVSILNSLVFDNILKLDLEGADNIIFNNNAEDIINAVDNDVQAIGFFLNPVKIDQIMSVALAGDKMPPKSTFFYPKVLSGLVINKHEYSNL